MIGWRFDYEPLDLRGYIPDFIVHGTRPLLVEVKGDALGTDDLLAHTAKIERSGWSGEALLLPAVLQPDPSGQSDALTIAGLIGERDHGGGWVWNSPALQLCGTETDAKPLLGLFSEEGSWHCRGCGGRHGPRAWDCQCLDGPCAGTDHEVRAARKLWSIAAEATRWVPAAALALLLAGCDVTQVDRHTSTSTTAPAPARYVVELDEQTPPGEREVEAVARCDAGDQVLAGGCAWGDIVDAHDMPLRPLEDAPTADGGGWVCRGQNTGAGVELKLLRATALCEASP